jgi:ribosomal-protein-alanine N-acetyltransferase
VWYRNLNVTQASPPFKPPEFHIAEINFSYCVDQDLHPINVSQIVRGFFQSAFLGYYIFEPFARNKYMGDGLSLVLNEAFMKLDLHRLEANIQPKNIRSKKLVKRLGFRLEGFSPKYLNVDGKWCDHERWAITKDIWETNIKKKPS